MSDDIIATLKENVIQGRKTKEDEGIDEALSGTPGVVELTGLALEKNIPPETIISQALTSNYLAGSDFRNAGCGRKVFDKGVLYPGYASLCRGSRRRYGHTEAALGGSQR